MIQITPQMRVLVAIERVDGRKGIDSLVRLCQEKLADPFSGCVFVFRSRSGTAIRLLNYDSQGYGWRKNVFHEENSCGGRKDTEPPSPWKPMRRSC